MKLKAKNNRWKMLNDKLTVKSEFLKKKIFFLTLARLHNRRRKRLKKLHHTQKEAVMSFPG